jgi:hypothetical protein
MAGRMRTIRLILGLALGLAFFGCVGLPRRRPATEGVMPRSPLAQRGGHEQSSPQLRIPADPEPVADPEPIAPAVQKELPAPKQESIPASERPLTRTSVPPLPASRSSEASSIGTGTAGEPAPLPGSSTRIAPALQSLRHIHQAAVQQHDRMESYIVKLTRREVVRGKKQPPEVILFKFRKEPFSVYMKWLEETAQGREVVYVKGQHEGKIHTLLAAGDMPLMPAGGRISLAPDSLFVRNAGRHGITEAGIGTILDACGQLLVAMEKGDTSKGTLQYLGQQTREEFSNPLETILMTIPAGVEGSLPRGGRRWCFVDPETSLPALILTHDEKGQEVEYYRYERYLFPAKLDDADFDPNLLWPTKKGR